MFFNIVDPLAGKLKYHTPGSIELAALPGKKLHPYVLD